LFETLTSFIPKIRDIDYGEWVIDRENDGTPEHPIQFPFVTYTQVVREFEDTVYRFIKEHQDMELNRYGDILSAASIEWGMKSMEGANVGGFNGTTIMALIVGAIRAERFCDGALLGFFESGCILKWLLRLQEIDASTES
jgi:hypothetical protein